MNGIPDHAIKITYKGTKSSNYIFVWECKKGVVTTWQWTALAANGEEETKELAIQSARQWINGELRPKRELE